LWSVSVERQEVTANVNGGCLKIRLDLARAEPARAAQLRPRPIATRPVRTTSLTPRG